MRSINTFYNINKKSYFTECVPSLFAIFIMKTTTRDKNIMEHNFLCSLAFGIETSENLTPVSDTEKNELQKKRDKLFNCSSFPIPQILWWLPPPADWMININYIIFYSIHFRETKQ